MRCAHFKEKRKDGVRPNDRHAASFAKALSYRTTAEPLRYIRMNVGEVRSFQSDARYPSDEMGSKRRANTEYTGLFEPNRRVKTNADGWGRFTCRPGSLEVWVPYIPAAR